MNILVTGGAGFIGTHFIHHLVNNRPQIKIVNYDKLTYAADLSNLNNIAEGQGYFFVEGDICDRNLLDQVFEKHKIDCVLNFAAETHVDNSISGPGIFVQTNIFGTYTLLEVAKSHDVKLFLQISTDEVYGSIDKGYVRENALLNPSSPYSASKASADLLAVAYYKTFGLPVIISRSSNNYGSYQHDEKFIPTVIRSALKDEQIPVYGNGRNIRNWLQAEDNCRAINMLIDKGKIGRIYNISTDDELENIEIVKKILQILGKSESLISFVGDRLGHDFRYAADSSEIRSLGWKPLHNFDQALEEYVFSCRQKFKTLA